jgi:hypothetical protein
MTKLKKQYYRVPLKYVISTVTLLVKVGQYQVMVILPRSIEIEFAELYIGKISLHFFFVMLRLFLR